MATRDSIIRTALGRFPTTKVAHFRQGQYGKIVGRVRCTAPVRAPVSGRWCAFFEVSYMQLWESVWAEYNRHVGGNAFHVVDNSGEVLVDVSRCEVLLLPDHDLRRDTGYGGMYREHEGIVADGEKVAVLGYGTWEPDPDPRAVVGYRERPVKLVLRGSGNQLLLITDKPTIVNR